MLHAPAEPEDPSSPKPNGRGHHSWLKNIKNLFRSRPDPTLRETLEEYIEEYVEDTPENEEHSVSPQERALLSNILKLRNIEVTDVMIPRTDIIAISEDITQDELLNLLTQTQVSRLPVYRETLDNVLGTIHIKDILGAIARGHNINIEALITDVPIVSPAMPVLNLIVEMQANKRHMAMVIDEFGGIDGLVTVGDIIEAIIGEIDDEHDHDEPPQTVENPDGSIMIDARLSLDDFEQRFGVTFSEEEHEESDTIGGLLCFIAGRVPARGEIIKHAPSGIVFDVRDADPRRVRIIRMRARSNAAP